MSNNSVIPFNHLTINHLLTFLDQLDAINFIEAININEELSSLVTSSDYAFRYSIESFCGHKRIRICPRYFDIYEDNFTIDETNLVLISKRYSDVVLPELRLFVHPCFSVDAFRQLAKFYNAQFFKCFVRLLPFNTIRYSSDFGLVNVISFNRAISSGRILNEHEKKLFQRMHSLLYLII